MEYTTALLQLKAEVFNCPTYSLDMTIMQTIFFLLLFHLFFIFLSMVICIVKKNSVLSTKCICGSAEITSVLFYRLTHDTLLHHHYWKCSFVTYCMTALDNTK